METYAIVRLEPCCPNCFSTLEIPLQDRKDDPMPVLCQSCGWAGLAVIYFRVTGGTQKKLESYDADV